MDWGNIKARDSQFEREYQFSPDIDYIKEIDEYNRFNEERDAEGRMRFADKHNGFIAFWAKVAYYKELKEKGLL